MAAKLSEGDTIAMQGEVTHVHDDGKVTVRTHLVPNGRFSWPTCKQRAYGERLAVT
jgi:hypothetical protein